MKRLIMFICAALSIITCTKPENGNNPPDVAVSSVMLDRQTLDLSKGETTILKADVLPANAGDKSVSWSSSNPAAATVEQSGKVTAVSSGSTTITVTTNDGGKTAVCSVLVDDGNYAVTGLSKEAAEEARLKVIEDWKAARMNEMTVNYNRNFVIGKNNVAMKYYINCYGKEPEGGHSLWISLHGGGGTTAAVNNEQWSNQQIMYRYAKTPQPIEGYYISPRSIDDVWDMWFLEENDSLFEQIITTLVVVKNVNPDKVYLMGYSAGGDGVWRMAPRLADHWAAAAMMAGHPGNVNLMNVRNLPFTLWVGGEDTAYDRNKLVPQKATELEFMHSKDPEGYIYNCHVLKGKPHWMDLEDAAAFDWMAGYSRNPYPTRIVWRQEGEERNVVRQFFYWIKVERNEMKKANTVIAEIKDNVITIEKSDYKTLTFYLNDSMADLDKPVKVVFDGQLVFKGMVERSRNTLLSSMAERNDPSYTFCSELTVHLN